MKRIPKRYNKKSPSQAKGAWQGEQGKGNPGGTGRAHACLKPGARQAKLNWRSSASVGNGKSLPTTRGEKAQSYPTVAQGWKAAGATAAVSSELARDQPGQEK